MDRMTRNMPWADRRMLSRPTYRDIFVNAFLGAMRNGPCGIIADVSLVTRPWEFQLEDIAVPTSLWFGECDTTTPPVIGEHFASRLRTSQLSVIGRQGHISLLATHGEAILASAVG